jgi:hypothetical protein
MFNQLIDSGIRPDVAGELVNSGNGAGAAARVGNALMQYTGAAPSKTSQKAIRHFQTADALGSYFMRSGQPQLMAAGTALKNVAAMGGKLNESHYQLAERMNYRFRGMKDNLPQLFTESMASGPHRVATALFNDPNLGPQRWAEIRDKVFSQPARRERALSTDKGGNVQFSDTTAAIASYMDRNPRFTNRMSPRDFVDRFVGDIAVTSLIPEIPADKRAVELGQQAGFGVPSSGIIIRSDGQAKEMYRGVGEDHYLPFSAKALPELRDAQYVRTRVLGGHTGEDITTLVASGARRATVVSGSGVFSIELKPNTSLVGRMAQPEVAAMGERYERILDKLSSSGIYAVDLPNETMTELRRKAAEFTGKMPEDEEYKTHLTKLVTKARAQAAQITQEDIDSITERVDAQMELDTSAQSPQQKARLRDELLKDAMQDKENEKVRTLSLNGEGYALALETLRMQYPSIIANVEYESINDFVKNRELGGVLDRAAVTIRNRRNAKDSGLVKPGQTSAFAGNKKWSDERLEASRAEVLSSVVRRAAAAAEPAAAANAAEPGGEAAGAAAPGGAAANAAAAARAGTLPAAAGGADAAAAPSRGTGATVATLRTTMDKSTENALNAGASKLSGLLVADGVSVDQISGKKFLDMLIDDDPNSDAEDAKQPRRAQKAWAQAIPTAKRGYFTGSISGSALSGLGAGVTDPVGMEHSMRSPEGIVGVMYATFAGNKHLLAGLQHDQSVSPAASALSEDQKAELGAAVDELASLQLMHSGATTSQASEKLDEVTPSFFVRPEYLRFVEQNIQSGGLPEQLANLEKVLNDDSAPETAQRKRAAAGALDLLKGDDKFRSEVMHGTDISADPFEGLSVLGLLALQSKIQQEINAATPSGTGRGKALIEALGIDFSSIGSTDQPALLKAKQDAYKQYQDAIGAEYVYRLMGGGDVGPKVLGQHRGRLSKNSDLVEEFLRLTRESPPSLVPRA